MKNSLMTLSQYQKLLRDLEVNNNKLYKVDAKLKPYFLSLLKCVSK